MELFHKIALEEYILAMQENKHGDIEYVKLKTYEAYEWQLKNVGGTNGQNGEDQSLHKNK